MLVKPGWASNCIAGGSFGNHGMDGGQGEAARVPFADATLVKVPGSGHSDETMRSLLALSDVMCTGHHAAVSAGVKPGDVVAVVGDGAVGLCAMIAAKRLGAERIIALSRNPARQELARSFGATDTVAERGDDAIGVPHDVVVPIETVIFRNIGLRGGVAPVRRYLRPSSSAELLDDVLEGCINPGRVFDALAWLLARKPWIVPIPGTRKLERLDENSGAVAIELTPDDLREIESAASQITVQGARYPESLERLTKHLVRRRRQKMSSQFEHADDIARQPGAPDNFTGSVYFQPVATNEACQLGANRVTFQKGARTFWHTHSGEQVLYFLKGHGRVQERGSKALDAVEGDVVHIPEGTEHWHGAHPEEEHAMQHLAITFGKPTWLEPVSEDEYRAG